MRKINLKKNEICDNIRPLYGNRDRYGHALFGCDVMADKMQLNANGKSFLLNFFVNFFVNIELYCSNACLIIFWHCDNLRYSHITPTGGRPTVGEQNF